ncbi:hypothetical protein G7Y79_00022g053030 [Physcia stellaris]|nr:hypothetical protein G7Y79_00022g053030 [Physcia stellaris]
MASVPAKRSPTRICVFTSTTTCHSPLLKNAARDLAQTFHEHSIQLVYGGGTTGLMGELAATLVKLSGKDKGVIPASIITLERPHGAASAEQDTKDKLRKRWTGPLDFVSRLQKPTATSSSPSKLALLSEEKYGMTTVVPSLSARKQVMCTFTSSGAPGSGFVALSGVRGDGRAYGDDHTAAAGGA